MRTRLGFSVLTLAAGASLLAHALTLATFSVVEVRVGFDVAPHVAEMTVHFEEPAATQPAQEPAKEPTKHADKEFEIGRPDGVGYATHDAPGPREQAAREADQDQPSLSLDSVGNSARVEVPSAPAAQEPQRAMPSEAPELALPSPSQPPPVARSAPNPVLNPVPAIDLILQTPLPPKVGPSEVAEAQTVTAADVDGPTRVLPDETGPAEETRPAEKTRLVDETRLAIVVAPVPHPAPAAPPAPDPTPVAPQPPVPAVQRTGGTGADAAPLSDSEVDPFSTIGSVEFRGGKSIVRGGRRVKPRRPKLQLAGQVDLFGNSRAQVILRVSVDATGKVTDVQVSRSSGSNEIDQPCRVAMYEWWFEPKKAPDGKPIPDVFPFGIKFR